METQTYNSSNAPIEMQINTMDVPVGTRRKISKGNSNIHSQVITIFVPKQKLRNMFEDVNVDTNLHDSYRNYNVACL